MGLKREKSTVQGVIHRVREQRVPGERLGKGVVIGH